MAILHAPKGGDPHEDARRHIVLSATGTNNANYWNGSSYSDSSNYLTPAGCFAGSPGPYGTFDQGGNVNEWNEAFDTHYSVRFLRGGSFSDDIARLHADYRGANDYKAELNRLGFRVALVPEPASMALLAIAGLLVARRRRA